MRLAKQREISNVIFQTMLENKINYEISNDITGQINEEYQNQKCFVYLEICNTKPLLSYVFNSDQQILIGRSIENTTIAIQDLSVSRTHGCFFVQSDYIYIRNCSKSQRIRIRRGFKNIWLNTNESSYLWKRDKIYIGKVIFRVYLFKGKDWIIN